MHSNAAKSHAHKHCIYLIGGKNAVILYFFLNLLYFCKYEYFLLYYIVLLSTRVVKLNNVVETLMHFKLNRIYLKSFITL